MSGDCVVIQKMDGVVKSSKTPGGKFGQSLGDHFDKFCDSQNKTQDQIVRDSQSQSIE